jgi:hypothetical protein
MQIQPEARKTVFKFEKIEIPLTEEDLVIRERPRRMPPPPPEGAPENANDRRNVRPKRPKPERRSFESFQEDLAAKVESEQAGRVKSIEVTVESTEVTIIVPKETTPANPPPEAPPTDEFGDGL